MFEYTVFVKIDEAGHIVEINSNAFLNTLDGWVEIDSGYGDKYHHAQGNYLEKPLYDDRGLYNYGYKDGKPYERTQAEKDAEYVPPVPVPTLEERLKEMEAALTALLEGETE